MSVFAALADPTRRRIVELLAEEPRAAGAIAQHFAMSQPAVSQHLKVLRDEGLVRVQVDGQRRIYELEPDSLLEIRDWLAGVTRFWTGRLDVLEMKLRDEEKGRE
ncbi:MAG TPA: metalloregulator ArsR/SmtB family transcription factor [Deinococcales bacterium]|nr:metalloregulator ArsR/SmtB family transcription factor [Deinococcales bacterium]